MLDNFWVAFILKKMQFEIRYQFLLDIFAANLNLTAHKCKFRHILKTSFSCRKHPSYQILLVFIKIHCNHSNVNLKITLFLYKSYKIWKGVSFLSDWIDDLEINHIIMSKFCNLSVGL